MPRSLSWMLLATHVPEHGQGGGIVRYTTELARALAQHPKVDLNVVAAVGGGQHFRRILPSRVTVIDVPRLPVVARSAVERYGVGAVIPRLSQRFDVVQGTKHLLPTIGAGCRVLTVHDMHPLQRPEEFNFLKRRLLKRPYMRSLTSADLLLCVSVATRQRLVEYLPDVASRARVVPLAPADMLICAPAEPVEALRQRNFALVVGDDSPRKNLNMVVDLWPDVLARRPDSLLAIVGPPSWGPSRRGRQYDELLSSGSVVHLGYLPDGTLRWCYEHANVVLCPSVAEGFGLPAAEAIAFGSPLITSEDPALVEAGSGQGLRLSVERPDRWVEAIIKLLSVERKPLGTPQPVRTWGDVAAETVECVLSVVQGPRAQRD